MTIAIPTYVGELHTWKESNEFRAWMVLVSQGGGGTTSPLTTKGDLWGFSTVDARVPVGTAGQILSADAFSVPGVKWINPPTGTVTSVALAMPTGYAVTGSPITTTGTLTVTGGPLDFRYAINKLYIVTNSGASATLGFTLIAFTGAGALGTGSWLGSTPRGTWVTAAGAGTQVSVVFGSPAWLWLGNASNRGGFRQEFIIGVETAVATTRCLFGLATAAINLAAADPSAATNCILFGSDAADANLQIMSNDAAGACTKVDLGANYPASTSGVAVRVVFTATRNATSVDWSVTRLDNTAIPPSTGTIAAADLPSNTTKLTPVGSVGNATTASTCSLAFIKLLVEEYAPA